jgi:putative DNA primase/helicase
MSADQIGIALKGRRNGRGWLVCCPCPNHGKGRGDRFPSLSVDDGDDGRLLLRCFAGCEFVDILDELKHRGIVDDSGTRNISPPARSEPKVDASPNAEALIIWRASEPLPHTVAAEYLERRGIVLRPPSLRCRIGKPALIAAVQAPDGKIIAIQQTRLTRDGAKASDQPRMTLGSLGAGAVRLGPAGKVLGLAEGVESALAAMQMTGLTVWASIGASRLHAVELPAEVKIVHIFCDNDDAGQAAARRAGKMHAGLGRTAHLRSPPSHCGDWNDYLNFHADRDGRDPLPAAEISA